MLYLGFQIGREQYALPSSDIVEVLPQLDLRSVPKAPAFIAGLLNYHETLVPVVDLCQLFGEGPCKQLNSTRIILARYLPSPGESAIIGMIAEHATTTLHIDETELQASVLDVADAPYLGRSYTLQGKGIQLVKVEKLLTDEVQALLYPAITEQADVSG